ncbi:MAG: WD40 repeat domain-containing protein [Candidatus Eremiobacteraeota bacterium]|nr:WD40 repeat domain-containing protein [Candidatus Eremiobacteraeota bacterium]
MKKMCLLLSCVALMGLFGMGVSYGADMVGSAPPDFVLLKQLPGEDPYWIYRPIFSPDGKLAAGFMHSPAKIVIWDLEKGTVIKEIEQSVHGMPGLDGWAFSKDGKMLLLIYRDLPLKFLDYMNGKIVKTLPINADPNKVWDFSFSPDMRLLALATNTGIKLWDIEKSAELKVYVKDKAVSGVDIVYYTTPKGQLVRLMAYGLLLKKEQAKTFKDVAGIINLDSGSTMIVLNDIPRDKVASGDTTNLWVSFERGGGYLLVAYSVFPPTVKAGAYLINASTGKYLANHNLENCILAFQAYYLWKPFYGYLLTTTDMRSEPYKSAMEFLVITKEGGLKVIDATKQDKIATKSVTISRDQTRALITTKKSQADPSQLFLYKLVPKKK